MITGQSPNPVDVCQSFPALPNPMIPRDNILDTLERVFQSDIDLLLIGGEEGIGRTTLLAQFAQRHRSNTFCAFIRPASRFSYEPSTIRYDLCCQLSAVFRPGEPCDPEQASELHLHNLLLRLRKHLRTTKFFFIVDGLSDIDDAGIRGSILDLLPIGQSIPVILSANENLLPAQFLRGMRVKTLEVVNISLDEATKYFADLNLDDGLVRDIYQACGKGIPSHLASVRRSIQGGSDPRLLVKEGLSNLFEVEWKQLAGDTLSFRIVTLLAHSQHRLRKEDLFRLLSCESGLLSQKLSRLSFLSVEDDTEYVSFVSPAFAQFAAGKTQSERNAVLDTIVDDLITRPETEVAIDNLPSYLQQRGKLAEVLASLSPDYFARAIEKGQSLLPLSRKVDIGIDAAFRLRQDGDLVRFGLQKSSLKEMEVSQGWRSEIEALIATGRRDVAMALASSTPLREERLHLLSVIARSDKEQGQTVEEGLISQIRLIYGQMDPTSLGDRAIDIAADLFFSCPDLAMDLMERASWTEGGENALDLAYVKLSLAASKSSGRSESADRLETILTRIKNPKLKGFTSTLAGGEHSAEEIISEAKQLDTAVDQLYLLRYWCVENPEREDAALVMDYSLQLLIGATGYAPNARVLREIATPIPFTKDIEKRKALVGVFDSQRATMSERGPTEDLMRLQLLLAMAERVYDIQACQNRLAEVYLEIIQIGDLATRASCLAWLLASFPAIDPTGEVDAKEQIGALSREALDRSIEELLASTADHFRITRNIIRAVASVDQKKSKDLALSLNTVRRREEGLLESIQSVLKRKIAEVDIAGLRSTFELLTDFTLRDQAAAEIAEFLSSQSSETAMSIAHLTEFLDVFYSISDPIERCRAISLSYSLLMSSPDSLANEATRKKVLAKLEDAFDQIEDLSSRIDTGYRIARSLAEHSPDLARQYLERSTTERQSGSFRAMSTQSAYQSCVRLCIRAFAGLLLKHHDNEADKIKLKDLIERIPGICRRAAIWAELAMRFLLSKRTDDAKAIVNKYVRPLLDSIPPGNEAARIGTLLFAAPALYLTHALTAKTVLTSLPQPHRDYAFSEIVEFILEKHIPSDPYEEDEQGFDIDYQDAVDVLELATEMETDSAVYSVIRAIGDTIVAKRKSERFSLQQKADVIERITRLITNKLPDAGNIKHQGYVLASKAQILRIGAAAPAQWQELVEEGRKIPNVSDRALVLAMMAKAMPARERSRQEEIIEEALRLSTTIPCSYDRIARLSDLASVMGPTFSKLAKQCLTEATKALSEFDAIGGRSTYRQIIDTAFKIDPDFAASLVSLTDEDPARGIARLEMNHRLNTLKKKKALIDEPDSCESLSYEDRSDVPHSAWMALGALNAGRTVTIHLEDTRPAVRLAGTYPLSQGYPILAWTIENAVHRLRDTGQAATTLREMFDALVLAADISGRIEASINRKTARPILSSATDVTKNSLLIGKGERDKAYQFIRDWLERYAKQYLKICDQYFGPDDLWLVMLIQSVRPECNISVLTSRKHQSQQGVTSAYEQYLAQWRALSEQEPPKVEIVIVGMEPSGVSPIHDRALLTEGAGIKIGTSWNSLGKTQESEISSLDERDAALLERSVDQYLMDRRRDYQGMRLRYQVVTL